MQETILKNFKILIVDDMEANVHMLEGMLRRGGYLNFKSTTDSRQTINLFDEYQPDLILLDLLMPHLDGFEVMKKLKSLIPAETYLPILMLTADVTAEAKQKALSEGAKDFLTKPFSITEVLLRINNLLETRNLHLQIQNQNKILEEKVSKRTAQLSLLYDAGLALNSMLEPRAQLEFLFKIAIDTLRADRAAFFSNKKKPKELGLELCLGYNEETRTRLREIQFSIIDDTTSVGWVAKNLVPLNLPEVSADHRSDLIDPAIRSALYVAVKHGEELLGVLNLSSTRQNAFSQNDERLLVLFANQAAVALENARLFQDAQRRLERVQALRNIEAAITSSLDLQVILDVLLDQIIAQLAIDAADMLLFNPSTQTLDFAVGYGFRTDALRHTQLRLGEGYAGQAALEQRIKYLPNLHRGNTDFLRSPLLKNEGFISYYGVPLIAKGQIKGVLEIFHRSPHASNPEWLDYLETLAGQAAIAIDNTTLFNDLQQANKDLTLSYDNTLEGWARALELRDQETEGHTRRVTEMTLHLARALRISEDEQVHIRRGALLHDIGKMGIPDDILLKPGALTSEEWEIMRMHSVYAYELLLPITYLHPALDIPYCHHEKWDGTGYPRGLEGEQIPMSARIFAVVDVWDAMLSDRPYRKAWPKDKVRAHLREQSGKHFDPQVLEAFLKIIK